MPSHRNGRYLAVAGAALAGVVAVAGIAWADRRTTAPPVDQPIAVQTADLVRTDLSTSQELTGNLGYGTARTVKGGAAGVVTWLPAPGKSIKRGRQLYRVDDQPVPLFYGGIPLYRPLKDLNTAGRDVRIVADNLRALGYAIGYQPQAGARIDLDPKPSPGATPAGKITVREGDGVLTPWLRMAIKHWQADEQLPTTGTIEPGDLAILPGAVRVDSVAVQPGDSADGPLMSVTPTAKVITVQADADQAGSIDQGDKVTVELPDQSKASGKVSAVGTALKPSDGSGNPDDPPKLTVTVTVDKPAAIAKLDSADVTVDFVAETHKGVLAAPVGALLALSEGGYALQLAGGGLVAVEIGMFAKGLVEVSGPGLTAGTKVVTTS
jgi:hypothetical protein